MSAGMSGEVIRGGSQKNDSSETRLNAAYKMVDLLLSDGNAKTSVADIASVALRSGDKNSLAAISEALNESLVIADTNLRQLLLSATSFDGESLSQSASSTHSTVAATISTISSSQGVKMKTIIPLARSVSGDAAEALRTLQAGVVSLRRSHSRLEVLIMILDFKIRKLKLT